MGRPSVKTLTTRLSVTSFQAETLRELMAGDCQANNLGEDSLALEFYDRIANGCGIECIGLPDGSMSPEVEIWYVNMGDTYHTTLMIVNGVFRVGCWGDIVERFDR